MNSEDRRTLRVRDKRKPGHCWQDNELYDVFQPVIGAQATHIFAAMTRWAFGHRVEMGVREIALESGTSRSTVQRAMLAMEKLGMLRIARGSGTAASAYDLLDLKESAVALGAEWNAQRSSHVLAPERARMLRAELKRSVPQGDTTNCGNLPVETTVSVPQGDSSGTLVSQKEGSSVPHRDRISSYRTKHKTTRLPSPTPPCEGGARRADSDSATSGLRPRSAGDGERHRADSDSATSALRPQIDAVMQGCRFSAKRLRNVIAEQLQGAVDRGKPAASASLRMIEQWKRFCAGRALLRYDWGAAKFFAEGHWDEDSEQWPWNERMTRRRL